MARQTRVFVDLDLGFFAHPITGDVSRKYDEDSIKQSVKNLVLTSAYERKFHSEINSGVNRLLFEPASPLLQATLRIAIINVISNFEPRVQVLDVKVGISNDSGSANIIIIFKIINTEKPLQIDLILNRSR